MKSIDLGKNQEECNIVCDCIKINKLGKGKTKEIVYDG